MRINYIKSSENTRNMWLTPCGHADFGTETCSAEYISEHDEVVASEGHAIHHEGNDSNALVAAHASMAC
jgi:hypothetical protein